MTRLRFRRGNVALTTALMTAPMLLLGAMGVDFGRQHLARAQLSQAVDAAALAGARALGGPNPSAVARQWFDANMRSGAVAVTSFSATPAADGQTLTVEAAGAIPATFLKLGGERWTTLPVGARAVARRTQAAMELALVLDVTGSMAGARIAELRAASLDLLAILFGTRSTSPTLHVAVVPYSSAVNVGWDRLAWLTPGSITVDPATGGQTQYQPFRWRGCVESRTGGEDVTDTPPAAAPFRPFLYPSTRASTAAAAWGQRSNGDPVFGDGDWGTAPAITSSETPDADDTNLVDPAQAFTPGNERKGPNVGCPQPVAGLTNDRASLERIVRALQPSYRGGTMGNTGLQGGWWALSPRWRGLWGRSPWGTVTPAGLPLDYTSAQQPVEKVMVMMTDGDNLWFDYSRPPGPDYTSYGRLSEGRLGTTNAGLATTAINTRMLIMCTQIKAAGIRIYTVTLGPLQPATRDLYSRCATGPGYYLHAPGPAELRGAFREIGSQLASLRLER